MAANKERLDVALVRRGLAPSRERARALIMAGQVFVDDRMVDKPGTLIPLDAQCRLAEAPEELKYVSRGGLKLEKALDTFQLSPRGLVALDVGASTGGFTHCLLEHGACVSSDPAVHTRVLDELQAWIREFTPFRLKGLTDSPIYGRDGNREFLIYLGLE